MPIQHYRTETYRARTSVGYLLKRAHSLLVDHLEPVLATSGFTFTQWVVLMHLRDGLALNATVLCAQLRHDSGALTRIIDQLEKRGLVSRERSRQDRRSVRLHLTAAGRQTVDGTMPAVVALMNAALGGFSRTELADLTRLLIKLTGTLENGSAAARVPA
ncbi:MAG TPA: MarR family transcriptional regulator [Steroidobacteraceae bacterium]|jgi:DNA-binding MarR family transcriptional regulator|nr:MarR family transcriptional regulator [Steroidobacteraceae bacterium]